ncbi:Protein kinase domain [Trypanosoma vivax]|uniref:Aurora kinase n=1 Tax=Trypanosoma vivax (strain Y486) TaxID=1055687 RepID=G0TT63_TRYVY|nr:putative serine/threonine-protein kinase [Trypanosoma vivax]KAH8619680.1 Protein kinase domain [Trypanosoma vivax]CCC47144.1 putative serine/threonine-protein kinase [Trypanosoma vivax Y486]
MIFPTTPSHTVCPSQTNFRQGLRSDGRHIPAEQFSGDLICSQGDFQEHKQLKPRLVVRQRDLRDEDFQRLEVLGEGSYSVVVSARHVPSRKLVALKELSRRQLRELRLEHQLRREINLHRGLRHQNIVRLLSYYITPRSVVLVLELCPNGTLLQKLRATAEGRFDEQQAAKYFRQVAEALAYLHDHGIVHRDLKPENVLLDVDGVARLGDFGWSKALGAPPTMSGRKREERDADVEGESSGRLTVCGTLDYLSPEMLRGQRHSCKADVWSLGALLVELLCGKPPFYRSSQQETLQAIRTAEPLLGSAEVMPPLARELALLMLQKDPDKRPTVVELLQHPWVRQQPK